MKSARFSASAPEILLWVALLLAGTYHEYAACLLSASFLVVLLVQAKKKGGLVWRSNAVSLFPLILSAALLIGVLWAVDPGTAFIGFLKFLPLLLYELLLQQEDRRGDILSRLPWAAGILTVLSVILTFIPGIKGYFSVYTRMYGVFQYPNTFAAFLLAAELLLVTREKLSWKEWILTGVLLGGILYTGSRMVFVLTALFNLFVFLTGPGKKRKWIALGVLAAVAAGVFLCGKLSRTYTPLTRLFVLSFKDSSLVGRFLYVRDCLPLILKHPFGMGYLGYYYIQHTVQTGLYTARFVHCDPAQILLDAGWIPFGFFVAACVRFFRAKTVGRGEKLAGLAVLLHCLLDYDMQFVAMGMILLTLAPPAEGKGKRIFRRAVPRRVLAGVCVLGVLYTAVAFFCARFGQLEVSQRLYLWNTPVESHILSGQTDVRQAGKMADHILARNDYVQIAYSAKSREAFAEGDFEELIRIKNKTFKRFPFAYREYEEYCRQLLYGISLYEKAGEEESAAFCRKELLLVPERLAALEDRLSDWGRIIFDQPTTVLPDDLMEEIEAQRALS